MEDINHQEDSTEIDNNVDDDDNINGNEDTSKIGEESDGEVVRERSFELNKNTFQRLKENDPDVTHL